MAKFTESVLKWFAYFEQMKVGDTLEIIKYGKSSPVMFIDMGKLFIDNGHPDFEFSNDYLYFKRMSIEYLFITE